MMRYIKVAAFQTKAILLLVILLPIISWVCLDENEYDYAFVHLVRDTRILCARESSPLIFKPLSYIWRIFAAQESRLILDISVWSLITCVSKEFTNPSTALALNHACRLCSKWASKPRWSLSTKLLFTVSLF